ncbi:ATPase AAA [Synergistales bacterium]|nr:ATPase AAA [Synergistales bacterium]
MEYHNRFTDKGLAERLQSSGAVLIEGAKGCGKTETAKQMAASIVRFDADEQVRVKMEIDPGSVLSGAVPRLLDEWQEYPRIWNYVRREVDERKQKGQFILTGSATPDDNVRRHSGVGRFSVIRMRPMSFYEKGWSTGEVSVAALMRREAPSSESVSFDIGELAEKITLGGWPGLIGESATEGLRFVSDYVSLIAEVDLSRVTDRRRDPYKVMRLLQSLARNISTEATITSLAKDTGGSDGGIDDETVAEYLSALERLMAVENLPAWNTHIRSSGTLRKSPKRHFSDPSLAVGALCLSVDKLTEDLNYFGLLFESLAIRDLRIYADANGGKVYHYRDSRGLEIDSVVEYADGTWGAFEIKLGIGAAEAAAENLLKFAAKIDTEKTKAPSALTVLTGNGFAYRRPDGVNVVPLPTLTA